MTSRSTLPSAASSSEHRLLPAGLLLCLLACPPLSAGEADPALLAEDEKLVREAGVRPDSAGLLGLFRRRTLSAEDRKAIQGLILRLGSRSFARREEASRKLEEWGVLALPYLRPARFHSDLEVARRAERCIAVIDRGPGPALPAAAVRLLAHRRPPEAVAVLLDYVPFADDSMVEEEVLAALLGLSREKGRRGSLREALRADAPATRGAAAYVLGRSADAEQREAVKKLLADEAPAVRFRAAQGLLGRREKSAVPALIDLLAAPSAELAARAETLLVRVTGDSGPAPLPSPLPLSPRGRGVRGEGGDAARKEHRDRWAKWWDDNAAAVELIALGEEPPQRGWTLIAQMSTSKVYEIDRKGKVRWSLDDLQGPIDAHALPGDRVLIAEHHGSRVTERNLRGEVLWQMKLENRPVSVQRLRNGNTFVTTYSSVAEFTRDGKVVYNVRPKGAAMAGRLYAGHRAPNGRAICITVEGTVYEVDGASGKVVKSFESGLRGCYSVQGLPNGHYLVASYNEGKVVEFDSAGKAVWRHSCPSAYHAERLPGGHTLISSHGQSRVVEVDRRGRTVAEHDTGGKNVWRVRRR